MTTNVTVKPSNQCHCTHLTNRQNSVKSLHLDHYKHIDIFRSLLFIFFVLAVAFVVELSVL